jgi:hypothetical protein
MVLLGFRRIQPYYESDDKKRKSEKVFEREFTPVSKNPKEWLPAIELFGEGIFIEFPSMEMWKLNDSTAAVGIEIARNFILLNRHQEALKIIDTVGKTCDKEYKILAAECAADLMAWTKMYGNAVENYDFALHIFRAIRENGDEFVILAEDEQQIIKNRINYKRGAIRKLAEQGRFTPDWLDYREAQRKHLEEESLLEAYWMYLDVTKNYPDTLCAEASECCLIKILTMLSNPAFIKEAAKRYDIVFDQLEDAKVQLRQAKRTAMAQPFMIGLETYVERLKYVVKMWESTPFGRKALQQAEERAEKFIEKNKYGLYRGEVLLDIGAAHLVSFFDLANGEKWLNRATDWFDEVQKFDKDLKDFELPESVRKASTPPKNERFTDRWNNVKMSQPKPGDFFNRRTCAWYWNSKRKDVILLQGLVAFAKEDYETAEKHWNLLAELDKEFYAQQKAAGWEDATTLARLIWNLRNQKGSLYATPEEMASFKDTKRRLAILIADLFYESEKHKEALSIYQRLENRELGTLSKNEKAYVMLGIFNCFCWDKNVDEIAYIEPKSKLFIGTPSECRAVFGYANRITQRGNLESYFRSIRSLEYCISKFFDSDDIETILFFYIDRCKAIADTINSNDFCDEKSTVRELYQKVKSMCRVYLNDQEKKIYRKAVETILSNIP